MRRAIRVFEAAFDEERKGWLNEAGGQFKTDPKTKRANSESIHRDDPLFAPGLPPESVPRDDRTAKTSVQAGAENVSNLVAL